MQAVFDLRRDPSEVLNLSDEELVEETKGPNRAIRTVYANKMPALVDLGLAPDLQAVVDFQAGMNVRAVIQRGIFDPQSGNIRTENSEPDPTRWTVVSKEVRPLENKWIKELHVVKLERAVKAGA